MWYRLHKPLRKPGNKFMTWFNIVCCRRRHTRRSMPMQDVGALNMQLEIRPCCQPRSLDCMVLASFMIIMLVHLLCIGNIVYCLDLSLYAALRAIHNVFYLSLLHDWFSNGVHANVPPIKTDCKAEYKVASIKGYCECNGEL